jgi:hypothetical protein
MTPMISRLHRLDADLAGKLEGQSPRQLRKAASAAALLAVNSTRLTDPRLDAALAVVRDSIPGSRAECSVAEQLTEELDGIAWDTQDKVNEGTAAQEAYLEAFRRARAAAGGRVRAGS